MIFISDLPSVCLAEDFLFSLASIFKYGVYFRRADFKACAALDAKGLVDDVNFLPLPADSFNWAGIFT